MQLCVNLNMYIFFIIIHKLNKNHKNIHFLSNIN
jgi:hypothetical protein